ncbi:MAG TPA: ribosome biogenesis factor YjgA [Steroidobacteraceae bacterium]|jgi:ribosome-associated protein|nr:ribosome biogenesis factor YjgA [Steroidobacteraceae bacterium]
MRRRELPGGIPPPTKTELKRQARAVQDLADRLVDAPDGVVEGLGLPEKLADAIALARRIGGGGALVRQRQFVAKLMRGLDLEPVRAALDAATVDARLEAAKFKRAERWRDRLLDGGEEALAEFTAAFGADRAQLEALVRAAAGERRTGRPAGAGRRLFREVSERLAVPD